MEDPRPAAVRIVAELCRRWWRLEAGIVDGGGAVIGGRSCCVERARRRIAEGGEAGVEVVEEPGSLLARARVGAGRWLLVCAHGPEVPAPAEVARLRELLEVAAVPPEPQRRAPRRFDRIIGRSRAMLEMLRLVDKVIDSDASVFIQGESGTGKELVARAIHEGGRRARRAFVAQNCSALNDNLLESALFGHMRGSFTGATRDQPGLFEAADGGTLFLDEIGDMSPALQVKLLRVLQEGTFSPVGATESRRVDVRVLTASHKDLFELTRRGEFREDLYYRVHVLRIPVPPLRERLDDLEALCGHFLLHRFRPRVDGAEPPRLAPATIELLRRYSWPGNVRELENEIERLLVLGSGLDELGPDLLSPRLLEEARLAAPPAAARGGTLKEAVERLERELIAEGLSRTGGNRAQVARELGLGRAALAARIERLGLERR